MWVRNRRRSVIWLNGTVGAGKTAVGRELARLLAPASFVDGDDVAGPPDQPATWRWRAALRALLQQVRRRGAAAILIVAYPIDHLGFAKLRAACGRARRHLVLVTLAPPLAVTRRSRGNRVLDPAELARVRQMYSEGYHRRRFAAFTLANTATTPRQTARQIMRRIRD